MTDTPHYTYRAEWSPEDGEYVGLAVEFPALSWLAESPHKAVEGIANVVGTEVQQILIDGGTPPAPRVPVNDHDLQALEIDLEVAHIGEILERHGVAPTQEMVTELWEWSDSLRTP